MDGLREHLEAQYSIGVNEVSRLDAGVFRVGLVGQPAWVARVFGPGRTLADAEGDARILRRLEQAGFPAERCAGAEPVSEFGGRAVLVTEYVSGQPAPGNGRTYAILGALLGRLHARPGTGARPGGAWHHLVPRGGPTEEVAAAVALLDSASGRVPAGQSVALDTLREQVWDTDTCDDLPQAFVHPDFVPPNAITTDDGRTVIVDWAGSGRGPRLWSLGFLLWAAGARQLGLVDAVVSRYRRHTQLEPGELDRLAGAIRARPLMIDAWSVGHGRKQPAEAAAALGSRDRLSEVIAARAWAAFSQEPG
jgi:Ser/Thr protein kinase RdoA (MazF antagonist)